MIRRVCNPESRNIELVRLVIISVLELWPSCAQCFGQPWEFGSLLSFLRVCWKSDTHTQSQQDDMKGI